MTKEKNSLHPCVCCGNLTIEDPGSYDICNVCGWEDDPVQNKRPDMTGGANDMSLNEARAAYKEGRKVS